MVDAVDVDGGHVHVTIRLTIPGCPLKSNLEAQVRMHVGAVPGVEAVTVGFTHMDEAQRAALRTQLQRRPEPRASARSRSRSARA